jgi:hypothetical protein
MGTQLSVPGAGGIGLFFACFGMVLDLTAAKRQQVPIRALPEAKFELGF